MKVRLKLQPGQKGAKKLTSKYGSKLICVRYRYDEKQGKRFTTVELIVDETPWTPPRTKDPDMYLKIKRTEFKLHTLIKNAGGSWDRAKFVWILPLSKVKELGLEDRIKTEKSGE
jgi:hypothetical protein